MNEINEENKFLIADLVMRGVHASGDEWQFWIDKVEKFIDSLDLPNKKCSECGIEMRLFDWHMRQGMCRGCSEEIMTKMREEGYGEI